MARRKIFCVPATGNGPELRMRRNVFRGNRLPVDGFVAAHVLGRSRGSRLALPVSFVYRDRRGDRRVTESRPAFTSSPRRTVYAITGGTSVFRNSCARRKPRLYCSVKSPWLYAG